MAAIAEKMVGEMVNKREIRAGDREGVLKSLLQNRRYTQRHHPTVTQTQMTYIRAFQLMPSPKATSETGTYLSKSEQST